MHRLHYSVSDTNTNCDTNYHTYGIDIYVYWTILKWLYLTKNIVKGCMLTHNNYFLLKFCHVSCSYLLRPLDIHMESHDVQIALLLLLEVVQCLIV